MVPVSDEIGLRPMRWWDVERLLPLERGLFGADAWSAETWWGELAHAGNGGPRWYAVAEHRLGQGPRGPLLGYVGLSVNGPEADVMTIAVAEEAQGRGLASRMLCALLEEARRREATEVLLEVRADNEAAQRLYARQGFEQIALRRGYYGDADGLIMRLRPLQPGAAEPASDTSVVGSPRD
jgi:ribosomal-protein-alanine N-acetyltransferase